MLIFQTEREGVVVYTSNDATFIIELNFITLSLATKELINNNIEMIINFE